LLIVIGNAPSVEFEERAWQRSAGRRSAVAGYKKQPSARRSRANSKWF
jgi:hypothetical protein